MYRKFLYLVMCTLVMTFHLHAMDKNKEKHRSSLVAESIGELLKAKHKHRNIENVELQIALNENIKKNRGKLTEIWHTVFFNAQVMPILNATERTIIISINATQANKNLKDFYRPHIQTKTIKKIAKGKITGPLGTPKDNQAQPAKRSCCINVWYSLALLSAGWFGKVWWDNGGSKLMKNTALLVFNTIKSAL